MSALAEEAPAPAYSKPRRRDCGRCGDEVLAVPMGSGLLTVLVEVAEVEPRQRCPTCLSARLRDPEVVCWRCGAQPFREGWIGEDLSYVLAVALDGHGRARPYIPSATRLRETEAVHKVHHC